MLTDIEIKKTYNKDLLHEFYIPVLSESILYERTTAYFSTEVFILAAKGVSKFFAQKGKYKLITSVYFSQKDLDAINNDILVNKSILNKARELTENDILSDIQNSYLSFFAYLLKENLLEIKVALITDDNAALFHEKVGILTDEENNSLAFSGSANETLGGWYRNIEDLSVYKGWVKEEYDWYISKKNLFNEYWNNNSDRCKVIPLPLAAKDQIIKIAPRDESKINKIIKKIEEEENKENSITLYDYQEKAIEKWQGNNFMGLFSMATGTGKTFTSLGGVDLINQQKHGYLTVIVVPQTHLGDQWIDSVYELLNPQVIVKAYGGNKIWKKQVKDLLSSTRDGFTNRGIIVTTYSTYSNKEFIKLMKEYGDDKKIKIQIIADEVHNAGAETFQKGLLEIYKYRIGLSATPIRKYDEEGTDKIFSYFDGYIFEYSLKRAIADGWLEKYNYFTIEYSLTPEELEEYKIISKKIRRLINIKDKKYGESLTILLSKRAKIIKKAFNKYDALIEILNKLIDKNDIKYTLIYAHETDQLEQIQKILNKLSVTNHRITSSESLEERQAIINSFSIGEYSCLVAMKCLDEGVDIREARNAILLANSTVEREYIQRLGRIIRKSPIKQISNVYDFICVPANQQSIIREEKEILSKELDRVSILMDTASNGVTILNWLIDIYKRYNTNPSKNEKTK